MKNASRTVIPKYLSAIGLTACLSGFAVPALAAGFMMVDRSMLPHTPNITRPRPVTPILRGGVSVGLHLCDQNIRVEIVDHIAKTYITQTFQNDTDSDLAGTYLFPLPDDTTFSSFSLHIDGKPVEGKILEAGQARAEYEAIVRAMIDPGLLEYADRKTVRARIYPIPAHGKKKVELEYTQLLKADGGLLKYKYPLKGKGTAHDGASGGTVSGADTHLSIRISGGQGIKTIWSPSHPIHTDRDGVHRARIIYDQKDDQSDRDFLLYYSLSDKDIGADLITYKLDGEDGYFLLTVNPSLGKGSMQAQGKDLVVAADVSGSMMGEKLDQLKKALKLTIKSLSTQNNDRFGIVAFGTDADSFANQMMPASPQNISRALNFIDDLEARGGTNISDALKVSMSLFENRDSKRPAYLILMSDGEPTVGETDETKLTNRAARQRGVRIFDFGIGYDVNTHLLDKLAREHRGTSQYVEPGENLEQAVSALCTKIASPAMTDVQIQYEGVTVKDVYPRQVGDLFAGNQVMLLGRYKNAAENARIKLVGTVNGVTRSQDFAVRFASKETGQSALPRLWAMRRIAHLTEAARANGNNREVVDEIVLLSKKYGIISAYTSFLSKDPNENSSMSSSGGMAGAFGVPRRSMHNLRMGQAEGLVANEARALFKQDAPRSGKGAVMMAKAESKLKSAEFAGALDKSVGGAISKCVDGKCFVRDAYGVYRESGLMERDGGAGEKKRIRVVFASKEYFALAAAHARLARYFAVGRLVVVEFEGKVYEVVAG